MCSFSGMERRFERERRRILGLEPPRQAHARLLRSALGLERFGARDHREVHLAADDRFSRVVHEYLRGGTADAAVEAMPRVDAQRGSQPIDG